MSQTLRGNLVAQMLTTVICQGIAVDHDDILMLDGYVKGNVSARDLLAHIRQFATLSEYQEWLFMSVERMIDDDKTPASVEKIVAEVEAYIRCKRVVGD